MSSITLKIIVGVLVFLSGLAFFLLYLPERPDPMVSPSVVPLEIEGNYSINQSVNDEPTIAKVESFPTYSQNEGKGREIILSDLSAHAVGDEIDLYIPQENRSYLGEVAEVDLTATGNRVLSGFFDKEMRRHRFIFTVGVSQTFGTLQTPKERYQLEVRNGVGRIISVAEITQDLDFSKPDYVIPKRRETSVQEVIGGGAR